MIILLSSIAHSYGSFFFFFFKYITFSLLPLSIWFIWLFPLFLRVSVYFYLTLSSLDLVRGPWYMSTIAFTPSSNFDSQCCDDIGKKGASPHSFLKILPLPDLLLKPAFASWVSTAWGYTSVSSSLEILQMCMTVLYKKRVCITLPRLNGLLILYWSETNLQNLFNFEKLHPVIFMAQNIQNNRGVHCSLIREITYLRKGQTIFYFFFPVFLLSFKILQTLDLTVHCELCQPCWTRCFCHI